MELANQTLEIGHLVPHMENSLSALAVTYDRYYAFVWHQLNILPASFFQPHALLKLTPENLTQIVYLPLKSTPENQDSLSVIVLRVQHHYNSYYIRFLDGSWQGCVGMCGIMIFEEWLVLKGSGQWETGHDESVEVNQRALIDKVLARYSGEFTGGISATQSDLYLILSL